MKIIIRCLVCKEVLKKTQQKFCSAKCRNIFASKIPRDRKKRFYCICSVCGKNYTKQKSKALRSKFCTRKCQGKALAMTNKGLKPIWPSNRVLFERNRNFTKDTK